MQSRGETLEDFGGDVIEQPSIGGREKNVLTMIATHRHVVERARNVNAKRSRHPCLPSERLWLTASTVRHSIHAVPPKTRRSSRNLRTSGPARISI